MTQAVLTIERAPRDKGELARVGRYQLHLLAEQLGAVDTPDAKAAWNRASHDERVARVHALLLERDRSPASGAARPVAPASAPARAVTYVPAVRADAVVAARAAAAPAPTGRPSAPSAAGDPELLASVHRLLEETRGLCERARDHVESSAGEGQELAAAVGALTKAVEALNDKADVVLGLLLLLVRRQLKTESAPALAQARAAAAEALAPD